MNIYPFDIWYAVFQKCDLLSQIKFISTCSRLYHSLFVTDMYTIPKICRIKLTNSVLRQKKFSKIIQLDLRGTAYVHDILSLSNLKKLHCANNTRIKDVSFMTNLKTLIMHDHCGIDQNGIRGLNLVKLNIGANKKIKDVSFMTNLKTLIMYDHCGIDQNGIRGLNLFELSASGNKKIKD